MREKIIILSAFIAMVFTFPVFAYYPETHAFLTEKTADFYNQRSNRKIFSELIPYLIDGSRREDDIPRWMNHFYDPVYNRGLTYDPKIKADINFGTWEASKYWANNEKNQNNATYKVPTTIASILTAVQQRKLSAISDETNYTWNKALRLYINGDKEKAMFALGHVIHLLQDLSVPDHTRNDPHAIGSVYEAFSKNNFSIDKQLEGKSIFQLGLLVNYFDELAIYSNNNFYSADTIGIQSGYNLPEPLTFEIRDNFIYAVNRDVDGEYYLFKKRNFGTLISPSRKEILLDPDDIQIDYWNRLAPRSVQYSAGLIDFFFKEAERLKDDKEFLSKEDKSLFASLIDALRNGAQRSQQTLREFFFGNRELYQGLTLADIEDIENLNSKETTEETLHVEKTQEIGILFTTTTVPTSTILKTSTSSKPIVFGTSTQRDAASTSKSITPALGEFTLRINEIMYDAEGSDDKKEWIEIFHMGGDTVDLTKLSLLENKTKHKIDYFAGSSTISYGEYAVFASNPEEFLKNNFAFPGNLFKSAMSLSNSGEELSLVAGDKTYISTEYSSVLGARGDGMSIQYFTGTWEVSFPTPGRANLRTSAGGGGGTTQTQTQQVQAEKPVDESTTTAAAVSHILISEIFFNAEGSDDGKEFIELYNPSSVPVNLDGWALRYKTDASVSTVSIISFNNSNGDQTVIPGNGYLLIGLSNYDSVNYNGRAADATRSRSLPNGSSRVRVILYDAEDTIVDEIFYDESSITEDGYSIERRSIDGGICYVPQRLFEFLGNGCDSGASWDFVVRATPLPQNSQNLIEPRFRPATPLPEDGKTNIAQYISNSIGISFNWKTVTPNTPSGRIWYRINEIKNGVSTTLIKTDLLSYFTHILEVGRDYKFEITAEDEEGYASEPGSYSISVPSFLTQMSVYADTREGKIGWYLLDLYYDSFPFFPSIFGRNTWQGLVFYQNRLPNQMNTELKTSNQLKVSDSDGVIEFIYPRCFGASATREQSFVFSLSPEWCLYPAEGLHSSSLDRAELEDNHLLISFAGENFSPSDYFTVGFYDFSNSGAGNQTLSLVAVDLTQYPFLLNPPSQRSPVLSGTLSANFDRTTSRVGLSLPSVYDNDTLDRNIVWESNYSPLGGELDPLLWTSLESSKNVTSEDSFLIGVKAKDDFGNYSSVATTTWEYPTTIIYIGQTEHNNWSGEFGTVAQNGRSTDPDTTNFQSFSPEENFSFDMVSLKLIQERLSDVGYIRLSVFPATEDGFLNNSSVVGNSTQTLIGPDPSGEYSFLFDTPISVEKDKAYWFALDVAGYSDNRGYFRNLWRNAMGGDLYPRGGSGSGLGNGQNPGTEMFTISNLNDADWYFKIGKKK